MRHVRHSKDFWSGLLFAAVGLVFMVIAPGYDIGTFARPGPGFFPVVLAGLAIVLGLATALRGLRAHDDRIERFALVPLGLVALAMVAFALTVERFGAVPAIVAATLIASYASRGFRWRTRLALAGVLAAFCVVVFVFGLGIPLVLVAGVF